MDAAGLGRTQERAHVLGILEMVEDEDERWLATRPGQRQDLVERGPATRGHHERHPLVPIEPADGRDGAALDLHDRDAQRGGMEDELVEGGPSLRDDEQPPRLASGRERLLDRPPAGHDLLILGESLDGRGAIRGRARQPGSDGLPIPPGARGRAVRRAAVRAVAGRPGGRRTRTEGWASGGSASSTTLPSVGTGGPAGLVAGERTAVGTAPLGGRRRTA